MYPLTASQDSTADGAISTAQKKLNNALPSMAIDANVTGIAAESRSRRTSTLKADAIENGKLLVAGGIAGAISKSCTAPLARLTILYQVSGFTPAGATSSPLFNAPRQPSLRQAMASIVQAEGIKALWKGNGATVIHRLPYSAINFWAFERLTESWNEALPPHRRSHTMDVTRRLVAGGVAGMTACAVAYPLDLLRTRLAAQVSGSYYSGIGSSLCTIVRDEGFIGLYRGLGATLLQVAPSLAINYCAYETLRSHWLTYRPERQSPTVTMSLLCGSCAGLISSTVTFPLDLTRRRMQLQGQHGKLAKYTSYPDVFRQIYARRGMAGFYSGIVPEYAKVIPGVAVAFCSYEIMKKMLGVQTNITNR